MMETDEGSSSSVAGESGVSVVGESAAGRAGRVHEKIARHNNAVVNVSSDFFMSQIQTRSMVECHSICGSNVLIFSGISKFFAFVV